MLAIDYDSYLLKIQLENLYHILQIITLRYIMHDSFFAKFKVEMITQALKYQS